MTPSTYPEPESRTAILRAAALTSECGHMVTPQQVSVKALKVYPPVWNHVKPFQFGSKLPHDEWEKDDKPIWDGWELLGLAALSERAESSSENQSSARHAREMQTSRGSAGGHPCKRVDAACGRDLQGEC